MRAHGCLYQQLSTCWHSLSRRDVRRPRHLRPVHREQSTVQPRFAVLLGLLPRELVLLLEAVSRPTGSPGAGKPLSFAGTFGRVVTQFAGPASQPLRHWRLLPRHLVGVGRMASSRAVRRVQIGDRLLRPSPALAPTRRLWRPRSRRMLSHPSWLPGRGAWAGGAGTAPCPGVGFTPTPPR